MADASPSTESPRRRRLGRWERLSVLGIAVCLISLPLPWYRVRFDDNLSQSGLSSLGFADLALLVTLAAAGALLYREASGQRTPLPLHAGTLIAIAGAWAAAIVVVLALDRPETTVRGLEVDYRTAYGVFVALAGTALMVIAGIRLRRAQLRAEEPADRTAAAPPRSGG